MASITIWCQLVDGSYKSIEEEFQVFVQDGDNVDSLKEEVQRKRPNTLAHVDAADLTVWRVNDPPLADNVQLGKHWGKKLGPREKINQQDGWSDDSVLILVVVPDNAALGFTKVEGSLILGLDSTYTKAASLRELTDGDVAENKIHEEPSTGILPSFLREYQERVDSQRCIEGTDFKLLEDVFGETLSESFYSGTKEDIVQTPWRLVLPSEVRHLLDQYAGNGLWTEGFKEESLTGYFLFKLSSYLEEARGANDIKYLFRRNWPFSLIIDQDKSRYKYDPRSDYSIWINQSFARLLIEIHSKDPAKGQVRPMDYNRLLLQGASLIKLMNLIRKGEKKPEDSVLMVVYIDKDCIARRHLLFQNEKKGTSNENDVSYTTNSYTLTTREGRLGFAKVLYNLVGFLPEEAKDGRFAVNKEARDILNAMKKEAEGKKSFFATKKRSRNDNPGKESPEAADAKRQCQSNGPTDALEGAGYTLDRDDEFDDEFDVWGGTLERIFKLPPHLHRVRVKGDTSGKVYIAKELRPHSKELQILQVLNTPKSRCENIIQLFDTVEAGARTFIILPLLGSVFEQLEYDGGALRGRFIDLSRDLAKGLIFLHDNDIAHLDIKPENLVYTESYRLQVIDFDTSVYVKGEDYEIDDYLGTKDYMAPEIGTESSPRQKYSPIRADRYSCGRVYQTFARLHDGNDEGLADFAGKLMNPVPRNRPRLIEWCQPNTRTRDADDELMGIENETLDDDVVVERKTERLRKRLRIA